VSLAVEDLDEAIKGCQPMTPVGEAATDYRAAE